MRNYLPMGQGNVLLWLLVSLMLCAARIMAGCGGASLALKREYKKLMGGSRTN